MDCDLKISGVAGAGAKRAAPEMHQAGDCGQRMAVVMPGAKIPQTATSGKFWRAPGSPPLPAFLQLHRPKMQKSKTDLGQLLTLPGRGPKKGGEGGDAGDFSFRTPGGIKSGVPGSPPLPAFLQLHGVKNARQKWGLNQLLIVCPDRAPKKVVKPVIPVHFSVRAATGRKKGVEAGGKLDAAHSTTPSVLRFNE